MPSPLDGLKVLEFAGLAPGPFCGLLLADYGASVVRLDRIATGSEASKPTKDNLTRNKKSISVDLKSSAGVELVKKLVKTADVIIDPFRPGVLEKLGLGPDVLLGINERLIYARMSGFRRDGKYKDMAGHDINYIAVSGALSLFSRPPDPKPMFPGNILGDFAGGGLVCFTGILLAIIARGITNRGQVVEANMVDGANYLTTYPRLAMDAGWGGPRGTNMLDGGAAFYDVYETSDGEYMAVGAIEPQFYAALLKGLELNGADIPNRDDLADYKKLRTLFTATFMTKTRKEWEDVFDGTDACVTPVKSFRELRDEKYQLRELVTLKETPAVAKIDWSQKGGMVPGAKGAEADVLKVWGDDKASKL